MIFAVVDESCYGGHIVCFANKEDAENYVKQGGSNLDRIVQELEVEGSPQVVHLARSEDWYGTPIKIFTDLSEATMYEDPTGKLDYQVISCEVRHSL